MAARLLLLFIVAPIVELFLLIKVGSLIGIVPTVALVLLTAIIGSQLVRRQGLEVMNRIRVAQARGDVPAMEMLDGAALLLAGFLLLTPGLISDTLGFVLLIPRLRRHIARALVSRVVVFTPNGAGGGPWRGRSGSNDGTIEGEYERKSSNARKPDSDDRIDHHD